MDGQPQTVEPGQIVEIWGRVMLEQAGTSVRVIPLPAVVKVIPNERKGPLIRHRRIEPAAD